MKEPTRQTSCLDGKISSCVRNLDKLNLFKHGYVDLV